MINFYLFGATGDLAQKKIIPDLEIVSETTAEKGNNKIELIKVSRSSQPGFLTIDELKPRNTEDSENIVFLSTPADSYLDLIRQIKSIFSKVIIVLEKPWASSKKNLEDIIEEETDSCRLLFLDHYAFKDLGDFYKHNSEISDIYIMEARNHQIQNLGLDLVHSHAITLADNFYNFCSQIKNITEINNQTYIVRLVGRSDIVVHIGKGLIDFKALRLKNGEQLEVKSSDEYQKIITSLVKKDYSKFISKQAALDRWNWF
jgi:glucose-6-phosphate 1-dehydrogenase